MAKASKNNKKKGKNPNESATDIVDIKANANTTNSGKSMKEKM